MLEFLYNKLNIFEKYLIRKESAMPLQKDQTVTLLTMYNSTVYIAYDKVIHSDESYTFFQDKPGKYETSSLTIRKEIFPILCCLGLHVAPDQAYIDSYVLAAKKYFGADEIRDLRSTKQEERQ